MLRFVTTSRSEYGFSEARSETCVENDIFWSEIESGFREPGDTPPLRIPRSTSRVQTAVSCPAIRAYF